MRPRSGALSGNEAPTRTTAGTREKPVTENHAPHDPVHVKCRERAHLQKADRRLTGLGERGVGTGPLTGLGDDTVSTGQQGRLCSFVNALETTEWDTSKPLLKSTRGQPWDESRGWGAALQETPARMLPDPTGGDHTHLARR